MLVLLALIVSIVYQVDGGDAIITSSHGRRRGLAA
jgi:hypothetical protein